MKKITIATVKSFIKKNEQNLLINVKSRFDGMTDGVEDQNGGFNKIRKSDRFHNNTLGILGVWFTPSTRNWCEIYEDSNFTGYRVDNCCGCFIVAIPKAA
jgi:hypothetical protein